MMLGSYMLNESEFKEYTLAPNLVKLLEKLDLFESIKRCFLVKVI
jgi:hypothetical protein